MHGRLSDVEGLYRTGWKLSESSYWFIGGCGLYIFVTLMGCNQSSLETFAVTGQITYQGEPVAGADIGFVPQGDPSIKAARGTSDENGRFQLSVYVAPDEQPRGAMAGNYKVTVQKIVVPESSNNVEYHELISNPELQPKNLLPTIYAGVDSTPLVATVSADDKNVFDFALKDEP